MPHHRVARLILAAAVAASSAWPAVHAAQTPKGQFRARLSVVPLDLAMQGRIAGRGSVTATLNGPTLTVKGEFAALKTPATVARLHNGVKGIRGPAVFDLTLTPGTSGKINATLDLTPAQVEDLARERFYVQLHSEKAPDGNLWGWLLAQETKR